jgi:hypothetical protein
MRNLCQAESNDFNKLRFEIDETLHITDKKSNRVFIWFTIILQQLGIYLTKAWNTKNSRMEKMNIIVARAEKIIVVVL